MAYPQEHIKPYGNDGKKSEQVEEMFDNIAPAATAGGEAKSVEQSDEQHETSESKEND